MLLHLFQDASTQSKKLTHLYELIFQKGPISKADLLMETKLKQTTLNRFIDHLLGIQAIRESGFGQSSGGRPPALYQINERAAYLIGVDISRTYTQVILFDLHFNQLGKSSFSMTSAHVPDIVFSEIMSNIRQLLEENKITKEAVLGIGIGSVGPLIRKRGFIMEPELFPAPFWNKVDVFSYFKKEFAHAHLLLENGSNTAAKAEHFFNPHSFHNLLYCISGAGLRCGVLSNGRLVQTREGDSSAFGHITIERNGRDCSCGKKGCLLPYISIDGIKESLITRVKSGQPCILKKSILDQGLSTFSSDKLLWALKEHDPLVQEVIHQSAEYYGIGIANMVHILHPDCVILSGLLINDSPSYFEQVVNFAKKNITTRGKERIIFSKGMLKQGAPAIGAAILVFEDLLNQSY